MRPLTLTDDQSRRLLAGERVEVRRPVTPGDPSWTYSTISDDGLGGPPWLWEADEGGDWSPASCPLGQVGDVLWCREDFWVVNAGNTYRGTRVDYRHGEPKSLLHRRMIRGRLCCWRPAITMPRWACRMNARCVSVSVDTSGERPEWAGVFTKHEQENEPCEN